MGLNSETRNRSCQQKDLGRGQDRIAVRTYIRWACLMEQDRQFILRGYYRSYIF